MIAIVDYKAGNLCSVENALLREGAEFVVTSDPNEILSASKVILPGVGNAADAMANLRSFGLDTLIPRLRHPVLGICIGMQLMCRYSQEGDTQCLGIFDTDVRRFTPTPEAKVPHMGWNRLANLDSKLLRDVPSGSCVYFVHSYRPGLCQDTIATCRHGEDMFSAALKYENFYGVQFHPEKSGQVGEQIIRNFLALK